MSNVWKIFQEKTWIAKHMQIKHKHILVPDWRYQDFRHLLQNPKVSKNVMGFNNHIQRSTPPYYLDVDNPLPNSCFSQTFKSRKWFDTSWEDLYLGWCLFVVFWDIAILGDVQVTQPFPRNGQIIKRAYFSCISSKFSLYFPSHSSPPPHWICPVFPL